MQHRAGEDLFIPDFAVLHRSGRGQITMPISDALLLGEIVSPGSGKKDLIDRPREYAAAGVPFFMRADFRNGIAALSLRELVEGEYRPFVVAAAGAMFSTTKPFPFEVDPADLVDED
nr:Uma2 family endonuclease [Actinoplanes subtropicus]